MIILRNGISSKNNSVTGTILVINPQTLVTITAYILSPIPTHLTVVSSFPSRVVTVNCSLMEGNWYDKQNEEFTEFNAVV
jgi:hypothetical protein